MKHIHTYQDHIRESMGSNPEFSQAELAELIRLHEEMDAVDPRFFSTNQIGRGKFRISLTGSSGVPPELHIDKNADGTWSLISTSDDPDTYGMESTENFPSLADLIEHVRGIWIPT